MVASPHTGTSAAHHSGFLPERREDPGLLLSTLFLHNLIQQYENTEHYHNECKKQTERQQLLHHFSGQLPQPFPSLKSHTNFDSGSCLALFSFIPFYRFLTFIFCGLQFCQFLFCLAVKAAVVTAGNVAAFSLKRARRQGRQVGDH